MANKRSDFYKSLNINEGVKTPSFDYEPISEISNINWETETEFNRNWWQRIFDTTQDIVNNVSEGFLNFVDGIFDAATYVVGMFGDDNFKKGVQDVMNYDWQQHILNVGQQLNIGNAIMTGDIFSGVYWQDWADTFTLEGSRENLNKKAEGSYQNDWGGVGDFLRQAEQGIGYVLPSIAVSVISGGSAAPLMFGLTTGSAFGSGTTEALNEGAYYGQAALSGAISAGIEAGTELLTWGTGKIAGKILGKSTSFGTRIGAAQFGKEIGKLSAKEIGKAALEEGTEEFLSEILAPLARQVYDDDAIKNAWLDVGSEENIEMWKNAFISGGAGAIGGIFGQAVQGKVLKGKLTTKGIDLANQYEELVATHNEAIKEAQKGQNANQDFISQSENRIGELTKEFSTQMEEFRKSNPNEFKNLMEMIKNPKEFIRELKKSNNNLTKEQIDTYKTSYLENYESVVNAINEDTYSKIAKMNSSKNSTIEIGKATDFDINNFTQEFLDENGIVEGQTIKAYYDPESKLILINPEFKTQIYELMAHENISHGILDTNIKVRESLINAIEKDKKLNELYHKNDEKLSKLYNSEVLESERLASFLENFIKDQKTYNQVLKINQSNKLLNILNKIKAYLPKGSFLTQLEKAIARVEESQVPNTNTYKPRLAFSKVYNEQDKATGVEVHADIIKKVANGFQDKFINLNSVEDTIDTMINSTKELLSASDIRLDESKYRIARQTFVDFNELLNEPEKLEAELTKVVDKFLSAEIIFDTEMITDDLDVKENKIVVEDVLKLAGEDTEKFRAESIKELNKVLLDKSKDTRLVKIKTFYNNRIQTLVNTIANYKQTFNDVIRCKDMWDRTKKIFEENKARATKVGDLYIAKLDFYKNIFKGKFSYSKTKVNVSPSTITNVVNAMSSYTRENIEKLGGTWTTYEEVGERAISNEAIETSVLLLKRSFVEDKFPNRALTVEELNAFRTILRGVQNDIKDLISKEGIERHQQTFKADLELKVIDYANLKKTINILQRELNFNSSMDAVFANFFGSNSTIHNILYDNIFEALDNKYLAEARFRNEVQELLQEFGFWSKATSSPSKVFKEKVKFANREMPKGILMDIYAQTLTAKGLATLQDGGYAYKTEKGQTTEHIKLNPGLILEIDNILTEDERTFVEELVFNLYNDSWKKYKADKDIQIRNFTDVLETEIYYPTNKSDTNGKSLEQANFQNLDMSDQSFNKERNVKTTHLALLGIDIIDRARMYIDGLTKYGEMTQSLKMFDSLMKQWTTDSKGNRLSRDRLFAQNIPYWAEYKNYLIGQILGNNKGVLSGKMFGNLVAATLYGNVSVVLKQTASLPTILLEVSPRAWFKSLTKGWKNLNNYKETKSYIESQSGIAAQRWADFDSIAANTLQREVNKIGKFFGIPMEKMDEGVIVLFAWQSAQEEAKIRTKADIGTPENQKEAIKILNKIIVNTQSNAVPLNMSMSRSGNAGYIRKVLSYFSSDLQNKISRLNTLINESREAKKRLAALETYEKQQTIELQKAQLELDRAEEQELEKAQLKVDSIKDTLEAIKDIKTNEQAIISGSGVKEGLKYAFATLLSALMIGGIEELVKRLYGRKGWDENTLEDFGRNLLVETLTGNVPYASNIVNAIEYGTDIGGYDFTLLNSAVDVVKSISTMISKGEFDFKVFLDLATTLGQVSGIPIKNLYNLVMGIWKNVDGSGYKVEALFKGYSDTYLKKVYRESIANGQDKVANAYLELIMQSYKVGSTDKAINDELSRLYKLGFNAIPKNFITTDDEGKPFNGDFLSYYSQATKDIKSLLTDKAYQSLDDEYKAKVIKKVYDAYFDYAKVKLTKGSSTNRAVNILLKTNGKLALNRFVGVLSTLQQLNKEQAVAKINQLKGYSKAEKLLIMWLCGYSLTNENKVFLGNFLLKNGGKKSEIKELLK